MSDRGQLCVENARPGKRFRRPRGIPYARGVGRTVRPERANSRGIAVADHFHNGPIVDDGLPSARDVEPGIGELQSAETGLSFLFHRYRMDAVGQPRRQREVIVDAPGKADASRLPAVDAHRDEQFLVALGIHHLQIGIKVRGVLESQQHRRARVGGHRPRAAGAVGRSRQPSAHQFHAIGLSRSQRHHRAAREQTDGQPRQGRAARAMFLLRWPPCQAMTSRRAPCRRVYPVAAAIGHCARSFD